VKAVCAYEAQLGRRLSKWWHDWDICWPSL